MWEFLTGLISGTVSGTGMGGGTILILVLSVFLGVEQHVAQATNLVFFVPTSISAIIVSIKSKLIEWKIGIILAISGSVGAIIGANISTRMEVILLKRLFGAFLACIAIYEIYSLLKEYKRTCMNFVKGVLIGTAVTTAAYIMYNEGMLNKKKMTKQARKMAHKMGINF